jgi:hypothetical protein
MPSDEQPGFWELVKDLTAGAWGITKEVGKEVPGVIKSVAKETREGIKSYSENAKVEAQKHHLEHSKKMKKFEKRAKDAGISEESLARFIKEVGFEERKPEDPGGSGGLLEGINHNLGMWNQSMMETRFEQYIKNFNDYKKMYKEAVAQGGETLAITEEGLKDCGFTWSELLGTTEKGSAKDTKIAELKVQLALLERIKRKTENKKGNPRI